MCESSRVSPSVSSIAPVVGGPQRATGVLGHDPHPAVVAGGHGAGSAQLDRRVDGHRTGVKEIQRPDVECATPEIDARRGGRVHLHARIIMAASCSPGSRWRQAARLLSGSPDRRLARRCTCRPQPTGSGRRCTPNSDWGLALTREVAASSHRTAGDRRVRWIHRAGGPARACSRVGPRRGHPVRAQRRGA